MGDINNAISYLYHAFIAEIYAGVYLNTRIHISAHELVSRGNVGGIAVARLDEIT